jgi:hypothetical protein
MKATTIKIEGELLIELESAKPESLSLSAYVREVLLKSLRDRKMADAARAYQAFLEANPKERSSLEEWERAELEAPPRRRRR